jgi:hypothetical protein
MSGQLSRCRNCHQVGKPGFAFWIPGCLYGIDMHNSPFSLPFYFYKSKNITLILFHMTRETQNHLCGTVMRLLHSLAITACITVQFSSVQFIQFHQIHYMSKRTTGYRTSHYNIYIHTRIQMLMREVVNLQSNSFHLSWYDWSIHFQLHLI